ncbi:MAG: hypothetical protein C5B52_09155 [Bacteroidetes bacterium]|nr:MAG: hypothetical protein C5B52_09155 [Bacteroidota bacterium]
MIHRLRRIQQLNCDIDTAWSFFSTPTNLSMITPESMDFTILTEMRDETIHEGMIINYKISPFLRITLGWTTLITEVKEKKRFKDFQQKGPYKLWNHLHEFIPNADGVLMIDTVDYELPLGFIGELIHKLLIQKKLKSIFDYRHNILEKIFNK